MSRPPLNTAHLAVLQTRPAAKPAPLRPAAEPAVPPSPPAAAAPGAGPLRRGSLLNIIA